MAKLPVLLRPRSDGRVVATSVDFPDVGMVGSSFASLLGSLQKTLGVRLLRVPVSVQASLTGSRDVTAYRVSAAVTTKDSDDETVTVKIAVVSWTTQTSSGQLVVGRAPTVPGVEVVGRTETDVRSRASKALTKAIRGWDLQAVLAADEVLAPEIAWVDLPSAPHAARPSNASSDLPLEALGQELTRLASEKRLGRIDHRDPIVDQVLAVLATPSRSSVIVVGPPSVGKTALVEEVACRMHEGHVPPALKGRKMWRISANELIAGAKFTGMWQDRARMLIARSRAEHPVFAMGDPTGIVDAGKWSESDNNMSRLLRPAMDTGELTIICECTPEAVEALRLKEPSFIDSFHRIDLHEPSTEDALRIVSAAAGRFEETHGVSIDESAIASSIELSCRFEPYGALPGKAVRLLTEAVHQATSASEPGPLDREDVIESFSRRTGLPRTVLSDEMKLDLGDAERFLERRVLGQPEAVTAMVDLVAMIKAGLQEGSKPLGSYFFVGPTGVGKTELAKALAELIFGDRERFIRFDMGEYQAGDAVAKLIGSGWQGGGDGELTRLVREQPFSVVLLDEIEKAHRDVFDAILGLLGEGRLTDATGRTADFRNTVVIMTSNLGAAESEAHSLGFTRTAADLSESRRRHFISRAENFFRPEFFNRIDRIVVFTPLERGTIRRIARREIGRLVMREGVCRRQLLVEIDDAVVEHCATEGFHPKYGARPLQRQIEQSIAHPLARIIVKDGAGVGDLIRFRMADNEIRIELVHPAPPAEKPPRRDSSGLRHKATLDRGLTDTLAMAGRLAGDAQNPALRAVQEEADRLLAETHEPTFWDDPDQARAVLARYYELQRCSERLTALTRRADGLTEMARAMVAANDRTRLSELRGALEEIEDEADLLRLEVQGAAAGSSDATALVAVNGIGSGADTWASEILTMYERWAARTGRDAKPSKPGTIVIVGLSSYQLLRGEQGLHRRVGDHEASLLARVSVTRLGEPASGEGTADIVRQYQQGRRQYVKDPRTGVRTTNVRAVLDRGEIDTFLLNAARLISVEITE